MCLYSVNDCHGKVPWVKVRPYRLLTTGKKKLLHEYVKPQLVKTFQPTATPTLTTLTSFVYRAAQTNTKQCAITACESWQSQGCQKFRCWQA